MNNIKLSIKLILCATLITCNLASFAMSSQIPNPWTDCEKNLPQASKIAGFQLALPLKNYTTRAMTGMIEINWKIDKTRDCTIRKSSFEGLKGDTSGDYNVYPLKKETTLKNSAKVITRGNEKLVYVMYFAANKKYYSVSCEKGLTLEELNTIYELIAKAEGL